MLWVPIIMLAGLVLVVCGLGIVYQPDRPFATIAPGSSSEPTFVVQVIRPRLGLPLGGLLPPHLFGLDADLAFDSASSGASIHRVGPKQIELRADGWDLLLVLDDDGQVSPETRIVFHLVFQERLRKVRCRAGSPAIGRAATMMLAGTAELSGNFDIELPHCEDAETGAPLGWPSKPLTLHGSFDRLPIGTVPETD